LRSYGKGASLQYNRPRTAKLQRTLSRKSKSSPSSWAAYSYYSAKKASSIGANIADMTHFLVTYLSGERDVSIHPTGTFFGATKHATPSGKLIWAVYVPPWDEYDIPLKAGFDKYRIYRSGIWHEAMHIRFTPEDLFGWGNSLEREVFNIIEDRRIEDLGVEYWQGYAPERLYANAYGLALRPPVNSLFDKRGRLLEAFTQRLIAGKIKGRLDKAEADLVEETAQYVERKIAEANEEPDYFRKVATLRSLTEEVIRRLDLRDPKGSDSAILPDYGFKSPWEATRSPRFPARDPEQVEEEMEEFFKEKEKEASDTPSDCKKDPKEVTKQDVEAAREGSAEVKSEYEQATQKKQVDPELGYWVPIVSHMTPSNYRDQRFITDMTTHLKKWQTGYETIVGKTGSRLSIPDYIRHQDEPFATRLKRSVIGKKMLVIADFSGSMAVRVEDYKRSLISAIEVLNKIGSNIALFGFGGDPAQGEIFFKIKTFEEPRWTQRHSAKLAAVEASFGSTPLHTTYERLSKYVMKHKPDITVTMTDGSPDDEFKASEEIQKLKKHTRMVAFGIGDVEAEARDIARKLKGLGYHDSVAVDNVRELPPKLVKLFIPAT